MWTGAFEPNVLSRRSAFKTWQTIESNGTESTHTCSGARPGRVLKPYGMPDITNPFTSAYADVDAAPRWPVSEEVAIEVAIGPDDWNEMIKITNSGLTSGSPVNTTATFCGDTLFAKPPAVVIEKTRILMEAGVKPEIAVYADVDNARRYLIESGLLEEPLYWVVLPALPGGSLMHNPRQMISGLTRIVDSIHDINPNSIISVCAAGRPSVYLVTPAMLMSLHVRSGNGRHRLTLSPPRRPDRLQPGTTGSRESHSRKPRPHPHVRRPLP